MKIDFANSSLVRKWTGQVASHSTLAASLRGSDPSIRHSREGGNPRTNFPRKNVNRDTTTHVHTAALTLGAPKTNATAGATRKAP